MHRFFGRTANAIVAREQPAFERAGGSWEADRRRNPLGCTARSSGNLQEEADKSDITDSEQLKHIRLNNGVADTEVVHEVAQFR